MSVCSERACVCGCGVSVCVGGGGWGFNSDTKLQSAPADTS